MRNKTKNMIGIIGAMDEEVASLISKVEEAKKTTVAGMEFCEGMLDGTEVVIVKCGIGKVNAGTCGQILMILAQIKSLIPGWPALWMQKSISEILLYPRMPCSMILT